KVQALQPQHERLDAQGAAVLYRSGIITKDEAREPFGLPAVGEGFIDTITVPDVPADRAASEPPASGQRAPDPPPVLTPPEAASTPDDTEARRVKIWTAADRTVRNLETIFEAGARKL